MFCTEAPMFYTEGGPMFYTGGPGFYTEGGLGSLPSLSSPQNFQYYVIVTYCSRHSNIYKILKIRSISFVCKFQPNMCNYCILHNMRLHRLAQGL